MAKIGLFYGSTTGKTADVAEQIQAALGGESAVELHDIADCSETDLDDYDCLIIGCPTWDIGQLQGDWEGIFPDLDNLDFSGKQVAYFGTGDQIGYADNFLDAVGILEEKISSLGGQTVGYWPTDGYDFSESRAIRDGKFCGLALDEDNQDEQTEARIQAWTAQLKTALGL